MVHSFTLNKEALKRCFSVYVVWAKHANHHYLYVGKTGDNREGCNPVISRCGNHFSYNDIHSQIRNKISNHEERDYKYYFVHFDPYVTNGDNSQAIDKINEMERWLNEKVSSAHLEHKNALGANTVELLNPYSGSYVKQSEKQQRSSFRIDDARKQLDDLVSMLFDDIIKSL